MCGDMKVRAEVWPLAADEAGIWLLSGTDAWRGGNIPADGDVHYEALSLLADHGITGADTLALHSTSWRPDGPAMMCTYMAVVAVDEFARDRWPHALPVTPELAARVGPPATHGAAEPPLPDYWHVMLHGIRHLAYLLATNGEMAAVMGEAWAPHLAEFEPALAAMYSKRHAPAA